MMMKIEQLMETRPVAANSYRRDAFAHTILDVVEHHGCSRVVVDIDAGVAVQLAEDILRLGRIERETL